MTGQLQQAWNPSVLPIFQPANGNGFSNDGIWYRCNVNVSSTGVVTVTTPDNIQTVINLTAGLTQNLSLITLPANSYISATRVKTNVAFAGTTTLTATLGTTGTPTLYISATYNLQTAPGAANFAPASSAGNGVGCDTTAATALVLALTATVNNLNLITAGNVDVWFQHQIMP
jgi:hypothetical protein